MTKPDELTDFQATMRSLSEGREEAAWELTETYGPHVMRVIRLRKDRRMSAKLDTLDFVQMVWQSFFRNRERIATLKTPDELIRFLVSMAKNKVADEARRQFQTEKYNVNRERSLDDSDAAPLLPTIESTPLHVAIARECWSRLLQGQTERNQRIASLRLQGLTYVEIADVVGIHERTVRKVIDELLAVHARDLRDERQ